MAGSCGGNCRWPGCGDGPGFICKRAHALLPRGMALKSKIAKSLSIAKSALWGALLIGGITVILMAASLVIHTKFFVSMWFYSTIPAVWLQLSTGHSPMDSSGGLFPWFVLCGAVNGALGALIFAAIS